MSDVREQLAAYAHEAWSGWMRYLFEKSMPIKADWEGEPTSYTIPGWAVERWQRQMRTSYANLPEQEKESDRKGADRMLALVAPFVEGLHQALATEIRERFPRTAMSDDEVWAYIEEEYGIGRVTP